MNGLDQKGRDGVLSRKPRAPARRAPVMRSSVSKVVITTTANGSGTWGPASNRF